MSAASRPLVALEAPRDDLEMLSEWLLAAGFDAASTQEVCADDPRVVCSLVRWPVEVDLEALSKPVLVLYEPGADLQPVVGVAQEVLELPDSQDVKSLLEWSAALNAVLRQVVQAREAKRAEVRPQAVAFDAVDGDAPQLIAVGISTGGPTSLRQFFAGLPRDGGLPPIVIVQHIPPGFVQDLVDRLRQQTGYDVRFAEDGARLQQGVAYISPGDQHLRVVARATGMLLEWDDGPPIRGHKPAVDVLFESCARLSAPGLAVIMTGMGRDGALPMRALRDRGWQTVGQDEATCTIYGMPRAAKEAGATKLELPLDRIASWVAAQCGRARAQVD